jgi:hypothetical protein
VNTKKRLPCIHADKDLKLNQAEGKEVFTMKNNQSLQKIKKDIKSASTLLFLQQIMIDEIMIDSRNADSENDKVVYMPKNLGMAK